MGTIKHIWKLCCCGIYIESSRTIPTINNSIDTTRGIGVLLADTEDYIYHITDLNYDTPSPTFVDLDEKIKIVDRDQELFKPTEISGYNRLENEDIDTDIIQERSFEEIKADYAMKNHILYTMFVEVHDGVDDFVNGHLIFFEPCIEIKYSRNSLSYFISGIPLVWIYLIRKISPSLAIRMMGDSFIILDIISEDFQRFYIKDNPFEEMKEDIIGHISDFEELSRNRFMTCYLTKPDIKYIRKQLKIDDFYYNETGKILTNSVEELIKYLEFLSETYHKIAKMNSAARIQIKLRDKLQSGVFSDITIELE